MKALYWRPHRVSRVELLIVLLFAIGGLFLVERFRALRQLEHFQDKIEAATRAQHALETIRNERLAQGLEIDPESDLTGSGILGLINSPVTSNTGNLASKRSSINPNFAALVVQDLKTLGLEPGDRVALGLSGSFPAINIALFAAVETLELKAISIASTSSSQWGSNDPKMLWIDMERILQERGVFKLRSVAASLGAIKDRGEGLSNEGKAILREAIAYNGLQLIQAESLHESVEQRMKIYKAAGEIKAYINVGGGAASVGTHIGKKLYQPGLNLKSPIGAGRIDSVMSRFSLSGVPVLHLSKIRRLARRWGFPLNPQKPPAVGEGRIYVERIYNRWLAGGICLLLLFLMGAIIRSDLGFRLTRMARLSRGEIKAPEEMV